jgi:hypothetical protein
MFSDLYDVVSLLWCWRWPVAEGELTAIEIEPFGIKPDKDTIHLAVAYEFSVGNDGPFTGETFWRPLFPSVKRMLDAKDRLHISQQVLVRYRSDDPSVNRLDRRVWQDL